MPIYEYACQKCGEFEVMQRITEATLERCPKCRRKVKKLISNTSFQLKGSGWYVTDYARKGNGNGAKESSTSAKSDSAGGSESSSAGNKESAKSSDPKAAA